jgi:hypothetical protein
MRLPFGHALSAENDAAIRMPRRGKAMDAVGRPTHCFQYRRITKRKKKLQTTTDRLPAFPQFHFRFGGKEIKSANRIDKGQ